MSILAECPHCHEKQSISNKKCKCGLNLDSAKRSQKVKYWIKFRLPGGRQRKEMVGTSIEEARDADGKRRGQKREGRIFDMLPESRITFSELTSWYLELSQIKKLSSYRRVKTILENFNKKFENFIVNDLKSSDLTDYQEKRLEEGASPRTCDYETSVVKTMINRAFYDDKVDGRILKAFKPIPKKLKAGSNARKRIVSIQEYQRLVENAPFHLKMILITAYHSGMRQGELFKLRWSMVDRDAGFFRLPDTITKEGKSKDIPLNCHVQSVLDEIPRSIKHDYVFMYNGAALAEGAIKKSFRTCCKNSEIPHGRKVQNGVTFHDLRRSFKSNLLEAGVEKEYRDVICGHSLRGMDVHYLVVNDEALMRAIDRYTEWFDRQVEVISGSVPQTGPQVAEK